LYRGSSSQSSFRWPQFQYAFRPGSSAFYHSKCHDSVDRLPSYLSFRVALVALPNCRRALGRRDANQNCFVVCQSVNCKKALMVSYAAGDRRNTALENSSYTRPKSARSSRPWRSGCRFLTFAGPAEGSTEQSVDRRAAVGLCRLGRLILVAVWNCWQALRSGLREEWWGQRRRGPFSDTSLPCFRSEDASSAGDTGLACQHKRHVPWLQALHLYRETVPLRLNKNREWQY